MLAWIYQFLSRRYITVRYDDTLSKKRILHAGVPQGLVLSPSLFLLYIGINININTVYEYTDDIALR